MSLTEYSFNDSLNVISKFKNIKDISNEEIEELSKAIEFINKNIIYYIDDNEYLQYIKKCNIQNIIIIIKNVKNFNFYNYYLEFLIIQYYKFIKIFEIVDCYLHYSFIKSYFKKPKLKEDINKILYDDDFNYLFNKNNNLISL